MIWLGANGTYHTIWSKNQPCFASTLGFQRVKCVRLSGTIIATVLSSLSLSLVPFSTIIVLPEFCSQQKRMMRKCENENPMLSLRGSWTNCFLESCTITVEVARKPSDGEKTCTSSNARKSLKNHQKTLAGKKKKWKPIEMLVTP